MDKQYGFINGYTGTYVHTPEKLEMSSMSRLTGGASDRLLVAKTGTSMLPLLPWLTSWYRVCAMKRQVVFLCYKDENLLAPLCRFSFQFLPPVKIKKKKSQNYLQPEL